MHDTDLKRILVADDDTHLRLALCEFLRSKGYEVIEAADGLAALDLLASDSEIFLVFADIAMPKLDGISLLHEVKRTRPDVEVVMVTGSRDVDSAIRAMREGAFDYFRKPFLFDEVALTIDRILERKRLMRASFELEVLKERAILERRATLEAAFGLAQAVEEKDPYTKGHSERVARLAVELGRRLGFEEDKLERIRITGLLHDVGKIAIPQEILTQQRPLTRFELMLVRRHPEIGARILSPISFFEDIIPAIRHHHENFDGSGYPQGLRGDEIPVEAMIIKVCDCFDAITSERPYLRPLSTDDGLAFLRREAGKTLDANITEAFAEVLVEQRRFLEEMLSGMS